jgi:hypothetical protein
MPDEATPPNPSNTKPDPEPAFARNLLLEEVKHRRDTEWKIFAYATGVLLAIITAVVAISTRPGFTNFGTQQKVVLIATLLVLTVAAGLWLHRNLTIERAIIDQLVKADYELKHVKQFAASNKTTLLTGYIAALTLIFVITVWAILWLNGSQSPPPDGVAAKSEHASWYFAVSGDSRDCGDLIMPKIAQAIADHRQDEPVEFYWHLGDLRALYRLDCDMAMRKDSSYQCRPKKPLKDEPADVRAEYLAAAWPGSGLPGWIIGTAGAEQYRPDIRYGYLLVEVTPDGVAHTSFKEVFRDSSPEGPAQLARYCFDQNRQTSRKADDYVTAAKCSTPGKF